MKEVNIRFKDYASIVATESQGIGLALYTRTSQRIRWEIFSVLRIMRYERN
jgi:hypothetical protein